MANPTADPAAEPAVAVKRTPGPLTLRLLEFLCVAVLCAVGARFGLWFVPFIAAGAVCAVRPRSRGVVLAVVAGAIAGWALPIWIMALVGLPVGATARSIAALAGLPPYAALAITATLLLAALQALSAAWLTRAVLRRR